VDSVHETWNLACRQLVTEVSVSGRTRLDCRPRLRYIFANCRKATYPGVHHMATSTDGETPVTLINVFTVEPRNQQRLIDLLVEATESSVRHATGFISARLHRSFDGTKVTMYAEWRSAADYEAMRADPTPLPYLEQALTIARFEPGMYEVVRTFSLSPR